MGEAAAKLASGVALGPFLLKEKLALGGMAEIWSAEKNGQSVALKILQPVFAKDQSFRAMFQDEVDIATRLTHANIVQVFGAHELEGFVFQSMELLEGRDLRRVLSGLARASRWFPVRFALFVGQQVARALAYAHARRGDDGRSLEIVHRDVSPHNVMIALDGRVKVLDFGIARAAERLARTRPGVIKGKIPYMAPEQALSVGVTPQTDIFATGVVLWEMLSMRRLFRGESDPELLQQVVRAEIPPLKEQNEKVPDDAAQLIHKMLAQRAANRPASMQEVENELGRMIARHFGEVTREELAEWALPYLEESKRAPTMALPKPGFDEPEGDPTEPTPQIGNRSAQRAERAESGGRASPDRDPRDGMITEPTPEDPTADLTAEATGAFEEAMASWEPPEISSAGIALEEEEDLEERPATTSGPTVAMESVSPTLLLPQMQAETPRQPSNGDGGANEARRADRLRRPTKSEIIRAVESVPTIPVRASAVLAAAEQRVEVQSAPTPAGRTTSEIGMPAPPLPVERVAPAPTLTLPEVPAKRAASGGKERSDAASGDGSRASTPTEETERPRGSLLPLVALGLALMVVIALALLVLAD